MGRILTAAGSAPAALLVLLAAAGCGGGGHRASATTSSSSPGAAPASSATPGSTATTLAPGSTTTATTATTAPPPSTAPPSGSTVRITGFTVSPASPVACRAPTMVELRWTSTDATAVDLAVDGVFFATYGPGFQDHLEYLACDGRPHTYLLTARAGTERATASRTVTTRAG